MNETKGLVLSHLQAEMAKRLGFSLTEYAKSVWRGSAWRCTRCGSEESIVGKVMEVSGYPRNLTRDDILCYEEAEHSLTGCKGRLTWIGTPCV